MRLAAIRPELKSFLQGRFGARHAGWTRINCVEIKERVSLRQLAVCKQKHGIVSDGLVQQSYRLAQILGRACVESDCETDVLGTEISIVSQKIISWRLLNRRLFRGRELG